jgi:hypothetical protein
VTFERDYADRAYSVQMRGVTFEQALNQILAANQLFYKVINERTIMVIPDNAQKRALYEEQVIRTFFISHADATEIAQILNGVIRIPALAVAPQIVANKTNNTITVRASANIVQIIQRVVEQNDNPKAEVVLDVQILEVNRGRAKQFGIDLSQYAITAVFSPERDPRGTGDGNTATFAPQPFNLNTITRGISAADFYLSVPSAVVQFLETDTQSRLIAKPQLRGAEGQHGTVGRDGEVEQHLAVTMAGQRHQRRRDAVVVRVEIRRDLEEHRIPAQQLLVLDPDGDVQPPIRVGPSYMPGFEEDAHCWLLAVGYWLLKTRAGGQARIFRRQPKAGRRCVILPLGNRKADSCMQTADSQQPVANSQADPLAQLEEIRTSVLPILEAVRAEYEPRVRRGYPKIIDNVQRGGVIGLNLDPNFGVYFMTDGTDVYAELHAISLRTDTLSMANVEKFSGSPQHRRVEIGPDWIERHYRNLVSELLSDWNYQQLAIFRVDS